MRPGLTYDRDLWRRTAILVSMDTAPEMLVPITMKQMTLSLRSSGLLTELTRWIRALIWPQKPVSPALQQVQAAPTLLAEHLPLSNRTESVLTI